MYRNAIIMMLIVFLGAIQIPTSLFAANVVRVAVHESKPISFTTEDGKVRGIYPDILMEIARLADWDLQLVSVPWLEGLEQVEQGKVDLLGPIAFTKERMKRFDFNRETLIVEWGQIYLPVNSEIISIIDLQEKKIAVQRVISFSRN